MKKFDILCLWLVVASRCFALDEFQQSIHCDDVGPTVPKYNYQDYETAEQRFVSQREFTPNEGLDSVLPQQDAFWQNGIPFVNADETYDEEQRAAARMPKSTTAGIKRAREEDNNQNSVKKLKVEDGFLMPVSKTPILDAAIACILLGQGVDRQLDQGCHFTLTSYEQFEACINRISCKERKVKHKGSRKKALKRFFDFSPGWNQDIRLTVKEDKREAFSGRFDIIVEILRERGQKFSPVLLPVSSTDSSFVNADQESFADKCPDDALGVADVEILREDGYKPKKTQKSPKFNQITPRKSPVRAALIRCILQGNGIYRTDEQDPFSFEISNYQQFDEYLRANCDKANPATSLHSRKKTLTNILRFVNNTEPNSYFVTVRDEMRETFSRDMNTIATAEMASSAHTPGEEGSYGASLTWFNSELPMAEGYEAAVLEFEYGEVEELNSSPH